MGIGAALGAVATIGGSLISSGNSSDAMNNATQAQTAANDQAIAEQQREFGINQANQAPWLAAGQDALSQQMGLLGLGSGGATQQQSAISQLQNSPLYQSLFRNGQNTVLNNAAATGGLRGGNTQSSLANFGSDTLAQVIQQQLANLGGISGTGQTSANQLGSAGQNTANSISSLLSQNGQSQAGGILGTAGVNNNAINSISKSLGGLFGNSGFQSGLSGLFGGGNFSLPSSYTGSFGDNYSSIDPSSALSTVF